MPRKLIWAMPALYMAFILALSSIPGEVADGGPAPLGWLPSLLANLLHVPLYTGLALVWCLTLHVPTRLPPRRVAVIAVLLATAFGAIDELYQHLTPGRTPSLDDVATNALGALVGGIVFVYGLAWWRGRRGR